MCESVYVCVFVFVFVFVFVCVFVRTPSSPVDAAHCFSVGPVGRDVIPPS